MPASPPPATVLITTKNRKDELRKAIASCLQQTVPVEVLVIDDGSTDGTSDMVRKEFPAVRVDTARDSRGYIVQRNRGAQLASAPIVFSIDDDAVFESKLTVEQTLAEFDDPAIGAVAVPYIDVNRDPAVRQRAPDRDGTYIASEYRGTAHALRRDTFLALGGYRESLVHQAEEGDYCLRMLASGKLTRLGRGDPILHHESPKRDLTRQMTYNARNAVLFAWHHVPMPYLPVHLAGTCLNLLRYGVRTRYLRANLRGMMQGFGDAVRGRAPRRPVSRSVYRLQRWLRASGPVPLATVQERLARADERPLSEVS